MDQIEEYHKRNAEIFDKLYPELNDIAIYYSRHDRYNDKGHKSITPIPKKGFLEGKYVRCSDENCTGKYDLSGYIKTAIESNLKEMGRKPDQLTQTYPFTVQFQPDESIPIHPGMTATVYISIKNRAQRSGFVIPVEGVISDSDGTQFVWIYDTISQRVHKQQVDTGHVLKDSIEIIDGIHTGDQIIIAGAHFLKENQKVSPIQ